MDLADCSPAAVTSSRPGLHTCGMLSFIDGIALGTPNLKSHFKNVYYSSPQCACSRINVLLLFRHIVSLLNSLCAYENDL